MTDETKQVSPPPRSRARRFDAPRFSRSAKEADSSDMLSLIQDVPDADEEDSPPEPTEPSAKKPTQPADDAEPAEPAPTGPDFLRDYLRELQWSESDIARLLVGPALSHLTAEGLFRQHAANTPQDQALLIEALKRAGASGVPRDPALLSGLNPKHLLPDQPADLTQLVSQFAQLPDVQKRRFLALLDEPTPRQAIGASDSAPSTDAKAGPGKVAQKAPPSQKEPAAKREPVAKGDDVLNTVLKGSFDTLGTLIKGLLGDGRSGKSLAPNPKGSTLPGKKAPPIGEDEQAAPPQEEPPESSPDEDTSDPPASEDSDDAGTSDSTTYGPPAPADLPVDIGGDREPD